MGLIPNCGRDQLASDLVEATDEMAVGTDNTSTSTSDTSLGSREYLASTSDSSLTIETIGNTGEFEATIVINGGTEVTAGANINEWGLFSDGTLIYRDTISTIVVDAGEEASIAVTGDVQNI